MLTKSDLVQIDRLLKEQEKRLEGKISDSEKRTDSKILSFKDEILGKLEKIEQNIVLLVNDKVQLDDHELRITKLEKRSLTQ